MTAEIRELLELAAQAAGIRHIAYDNDYDGSRGLMLCDEIGRHEKTWNPLADDGDALRLAVKLQMKVYPGEAYPWNPKTADYDGRWSAVCDEDEEPDTYAATRRAIVRAAAQIGEQHD